MRSQRTPCFPGDTLIIASHNPGKVREIAALLAAHVGTVRSAGELGLPEPEETGATFAANAALKARAAAAGGWVALADDSGLVVPALGGAPGIYSARWGGPDKDFGVGMRRVQDELTAQVARGQAEDRRAHFVCALALAWPDGRLIAVEGTVHGQLVWPPRGEHGFGYDPMFVPEGHDRTFGEMAPAEKEVLSHRHHAFRQLIERLSS